MVYIVPCNISSIFVYLKDQFFQKLTSQQKRIAFIALVVFSLITTSILVYQYCFSAQLQAVQDEKSEAASLAFLKLYHGSQTDNIEVLEPRTRYTPGTEKDSPAGIYASEDPAFAAAHAFPWSSAEGVNLYYDSDENNSSQHVILEVPKSVEARLEQPIIIYEVDAKNFELLNIPPAGHNFRSLEAVKCLAKKRFENVKEAVQHYGGVVRILPESKSSMNICQPLSPSAVKIMSACPELIIGSYHLFQWDAVKTHITLAPAFQSLLQTLTELGALEAAEIHTLNDLNILLQKPQGQGGLLRKPGSERWEINDHPSWQAKQDDLEKLVDQLGFSQDQSLKKHCSVDHCIIFGARVERMETRISETLITLMKKAVKAEHIFLLGSKRKLVSEELAILAEKIEHIHNEKQKLYWKEVFASEEHATEANACALLWECNVPSELENTLNGRVVFVQSTRIGFSYKETIGHRTTTDVTTEDWSKFYQDGEKQSIFAIAEQPYGRLVDQLRTSVLTNAKKANVDLMLQRIANTTFHFARPNIKRESLSIILDEIARNVYRTFDTLRYLDQIQP